MRTRPPYEKLRARSTFSGLTEPFRGLGGPLFAVALVLGACAPSDGRELETVGQVEQAVCDPLDVACVTNGAPEWPLWSQQPDRLAPVFVPIEDPNAPEPEEQEDGENPVQFGVVACDPTLLGELPQNPNPKGPDLQNISTNFHLLQSLQLFASVVTKAASALKKFETQSTANPEKGDCRCEPDVSCFPPKFPEKKQISKQECLEYCDPNRPDPVECSKGFMVWLANDFQQSETGRAKWALEVVKWLDDMKAAIGDGRFTQGLSAFGGKLANLNELLSKYQCHIDMFTEGYHLGSYSYQRPDLHLCIPICGHGAYATLADTKDGRWGIGGRYTSHVLSEKHRAQMRTGGFAITAFGETLSLLPSLEFNLQMDGYEWFNREAPLGIPELGNLAAGGVSLAEAKKMGIFNVASEDQARSLDSNHDGRISPQEFIIATFVPFPYQAASSTAPVGWPRALASNVDWEGKSAAIMAAALNLEARLEPLERELGSIVIVPGATLIPYFKLQAGVKWHDEAYALRKRLETSLNQNSLAKIETADFDRNMHPFQAPDLTAEGGTSVSVKPEIGAKLNIGLKLGKLAQIGVTAHIGFSVDMRPSGSGGVMDLSTPLEQALVHSNPQGEDLECKATWAYKDQTYCSNAVIEGSERSFACTPLDTNNSCCLTFLPGQSGETRVCVDDWTGLTQEYCDASKLTRSTLELFVSKKVAKAIRNFWSAPFTASWTANKTCDECAADGTCPDALRTDALPDIGGCQKHGYCCTPSVTTPFGKAQQVIIANGVYDGARFQQPADMAYAAAGHELYVADSTTIRRVDLETGQVTTLAGAPGSGNVDGPGSVARFGTIGGVALDQNQLYVADRTNRSIRVVDIASGIVSTVITRAQSGLSAPRDVVPVDGFLYVTDSSRKVLVRVDPVAKTATTVAGLENVSGSQDGVGSAARFAEPVGLVSDAGGFLYVADRSNHRLRRFEIATARVLTVAGSGVAGSADGSGTSARLNAPTALAIDALGQIYFTQSTTPGMLRRFDPETGSVVSVAGAPSGTGTHDGLAPEVTFNSPLGVAPLPSGDVYVSDTTRGTLRKLGVACNQSIPGAIQYDVTQAECAGAFTAYRCVTETHANATGWTGPGCHPLHAGFQSACGCSSDLDCAPGESCDVDQRVCQLGGQPVACLCEPASPAACAGSTGRGCAAGACARSCVYDPVTAGSVCGPNQECTLDNVCLPKGGIQFSEQILWAVRNPSEPMHAIATYGMSELELIAALNAGIHVGLEIKLFKKMRKFTLWDWKRSFDIGSTEKAWFQAGLESTYQWDASSAGLLHNYQPSEVTRCPLHPGNDQPGEFIEECKMLLPSMAVNPVPPVLASLTSGIGNVVNFGFGTGQRVYETENLCIDGRPMLEWLQDPEELEATFGDASCEYVGPETGTRGSLVFPCSEAHLRALEHFGCLDTGLSPNSALLAQTSFASAVISATSPPIFDVESLLRDPEGTLEATNLKYSGALVAAWLDDVEECFESHHGDSVPCSCATDSDCNSGPGQSCVQGTCRNPDQSSAECPTIRTTGVDVQRCCGDGVQQAVEQCDDGNATAGDGCSATCTSEDKVACCLSSACVDVGTGAIASAAACRAAGGYSINGYSCAEIDGCGLDPVGSCQLDGECLSPAYESQCAAVSGTFTPGGSCPSTLRALVLQPGPAEGKDVIISSFAPSSSTNYQNAVQFSAGSWTNGGTPYDVRGLLEFDLSSIPAGASVVEARLSLHGDVQFPLYGQGTFNGLPPGHSSFTASNRSVLRRVTAPWTEGTVTWNTQPATTSDNQVFLEQSTTLDQDYGLDVTALVQDMIDAGARHGFLLELENEQHYAELTFCSSDHPDAGSRPRLMVQYRAP